MDLLVDLDVMAARAPDPLQMSAAELRAQLDFCRRAADWYAVRLAQLAARFDAIASETDCEGSVSPQDWIRHNCKMSGNAAARAVRVGRALPELQQTIRALHAGDIGYGHVALLAPLVHAVTEKHGEGGFDETEMLALAREHSVGRFFYDVRHAHHALDAEAALAEHEEIHERRRLQLRPSDDGSVVVSGLLDPVAGATLRTALEPLARRSDSHDVRSAEQRRADALVELAHHALDAGTLPTHHGQRPHLQITASLETLMGVRGAAAGELSFSPPIPYAVVQRFACDSTVARILLDGRSNVIDAGRSRRIASLSQRRALESVRDGCWFPGCDRPGSWCQVHHFDHWANGGTTDVAKLGLLCVRHHRMLHEEGWKLMRDTNGTLCAVPPLSRPSMTWRHGRRLAGEFAASLLDRRESGPRVGARPIPIRQIATQRTAARRPVAAMTC